MDTNRYLAVNYHCPISATPADVEDKSSDELLASRRMCDFWMELNSVEMFRIMGDGSKGGCLCVPDNVEIGRDC